MTIPINDLLYAHALLCHYARNTSSISRFEAYSLCDAINNFQRELRSELKPDACDFHVIADKQTGFCHVDPIGGWDVETST